MNFIYEPIVKEDIPYIFFLNEEQLKYEDLESMGPGQQDLISELLLKMILERKEVYKAVIDRDYIIAYICLELVEDYLELTDIFVLEEARGQGYGNRIMEDVIGLAEDLSKDLYLNLYRENKPALELYRKFGFKEHAEPGPGKLRMLRKI